MDIFQALDPKGKGTVMEQNFFDNAEDIFIHVLEQPDTEKAPEKDPRIVGELGGLASCEGVKKPIPEPPPLPGEVDEHPWTRT